MKKANIFITGFSGSGKTTVGREVAGRLGWPFVDTDDRIVRAAGNPIEAVFREDGEPRFRDLEHQALAEVCRAEGQVVSTGGGVVTDERNRRLMESSGVVVCLEATPATIMARLGRQGQAAGETGGRPMLEDPDPSGRVLALKARRQAQYALAHWTVHTDLLTPWEVVGEVVRAWELLADRSDDGPGQAEDDLAATVRTSARRYPVWVGWGVLDGLGQRVRRTMSPAAAYVITDDGAYRHGRAAQVSLEQAGVPTHMFRMPSGEASKSLDTVRHVYTWLASRRAERRHLVVAVGGGVVGDLAGYVAATYLRGLPFVQAPTTLLAMMDAAVGGKTGVDLPEGKNLVGAFHQPQFVLADVGALATLPRRELASGWAEAIKHGLILDESLVQLFEGERDAVLRLDERAATGVVRRSVGIKADVVTRDERETLGVRVLLNYGHTIGHAIEAATGYTEYLHGEAVSIGMMGAGMISARLGMLSERDLQRQRDLLEAYGLPVSCGGVDTDAVLRAMASDKKTVGGSIRWVLLEATGRAVTRDDVPREVIRAALRSLER